MQKGGGHPCREFQNFTEETKFFWSVSIIITSIKFQYAIEYDERILLILTPSYKQLNLLCKLTAK